MNSFFFLGFVCIGYSKHLFHSWPFFPHLVHCNLGHSVPQCPWFPHLLHIFFRPAFSLALCNASIFFLLVLFLSSFIFTVCSPFDSSSSSIGSSVSLNFTFLFSGYPTLFPLSFLSYGLKILPDLVFSSYISLSSSSLYSSDEEPS